MKKVLGIVLVFTILIGAGTIYANGNTGQNLSEWYKNAFHEESCKSLPDYENRACNQSRLLYQVKENSYLTSKKKTNSSKTLGVQRTSIQ